MRRWVLAAVAVVLLAAHQDFWLWGERSLVLGFLPAGLAYHAAYTAVVFVLLSAYVLFAWPAELEDQKVSGTLSSDGSETQR